MTTEPTLQPVDANELLTVDGGDHPIMSGTAQSDINKLLAQLDHAIAAAKEIKAS